MIRLLFFLVFWFFQFAILLASQHVCGLGFWLALTAMAGYMGLDIVSVPIMMLRAGKGLSIAFVSVLAMMPFFIWCLLFFAEFPVLSLQGVFVRVIPLLMAIAFLVFCRRLMRKKLEDEYFWEALLRHSNPFRLRAGIFFMVLMSLLFSVSALLGMLNKQ